MGGPRGVRNPTGGLTNGSRIVVAPYPPISRLDLNLLVALDAILTEASVTRAAVRLHVAQPTVSASLARLRVHFGDPLLIRQGRTYELTPLARRLTSPTSIALEEARRVFGMRTAWDPLEADREFVIYGSDYAFTTIGPTVSRLASTVAPGVTMRFEVLTPSVVDDAPTWLRGSDAMLLPHGYLRDLPFADLWTDRWVIVADRSNRICDTEITTESLADRSWVFTYNSRSAFTPIARQLEQLGLNPKVEVTVEGFLSLGHFISGSDRLGLLQASLVPHLARTGDFRVFDIPFAGTTTVNALWWHPLHTGDQGHAWLRSLFVEAANQRIRAWDSAEVKTPHSSDGHPVPQHPRGHRS